MPFGQKHSEREGTQQDIVDETTEGRPGLVEEELHLPGLQWVLNMSEEELVSFFHNVLKSRALITSIDFSLGDYKVKEQQSRVPGLAKLHNKPLKETAKVIVSALQQNPHIAGCRFSLTRTPAGENTSMLHVKVADKIPQGVQRVEGKLEKGDKEFNPTLKITYIPVR